MHVRVRVHVLCLSVSLSLCLSVLSICLCVALSQARLHARAEPCYTRVVIICSYNTTVWGAWVQLQDTGVHGKPD